MIKKSPIHIPNQTAESNPSFSQDELRRLLKIFRLENKLSIEKLGQLSGIDPEIIRDYEAGLFDLKMEGYELLFQAYLSLHQEPGAKQ